MSGPATITGFSASAIRAASRSTWIGSGEALPVTSRSMISLASVSPISKSQSSIGIETITGPLGGRLARWIAWAIARGTSSARAGSKANFT